MKKFDWGALIESAKEPLRLLVLAVIPFIIAYLTELDYQWVVIVTVLLRWIDSYLHQFAPKGEAGGLTRF